MNPAVLTIVQRPFTAACWRETLYLLIGFATATAAFIFVVTGLALSISLSIFVVGLPIAVAFIYVNRLFCDLDRLLARLVLGRPIERPYRRLPQGSLLKRGLSVIISPTAWRDIAWMIVSFPVALATFTAMVTAWATSLGLLTLPIWWRYNDTDDWFTSDLLGDGRFEPIQLLGIPLGILLVIVSAWLVRACALGQVFLASELLRPTREEELETRVETLTHTRAGAVDAAVTELERVERDLHGGAQARLVALNIDLGLAQQRLAAGDDDAARTHRGLEAALNSIAIGTTPPVSCWPTGRAASATCSRTGSGTSTSSSPRSGASRPTAWHSTPRSLRSCSRGTAEGRWTSSPRASSRCSRRWRRGAATRRSARLSSSPRERSRSTSPRSSPSSPYRRPTRTTDASSRCWPTCAE